MGGPCESGRTLWEDSVALEDPTDLERPYGKTIWEDPTDLGGPYGKTLQEDPMGGP